MDRIHLPAARHAYEQALTEWWDALNAATAAFEASMLHIEGHDVDDHLYADCLPCEAYANSYAHAEQRQQNARAEMIAWLPHASDSQWLRSPQFIRTKHPRPHLHRHRS